MLTNDDIDLSDSDVFADELQAHGDPRGELLSLELVAERASTSAEARWLNREAQRFRERHRNLVWPEALADTSVQTRAGFVLCGYSHELFRPGIPAELALYLRTIKIGVERLEGALPALIRAAADGLRLDWLSHRRSIHRGPPADLGGFAGLAGASGGRGVARLEFGEPVRNIGALAELTGLRTCQFNAPVDEAEIGLLAPLELEELGLVGPELDPIIVPLFGNTLTSLRLREFVGSLAPLAELPCLRSLELWDGSSVMHAELAQLHRLEDLHLPTLHRREDLAALRSLPLRQLEIDSLSSQLGPELGQLARLERLHIHSITDVPLDLEVLADLLELLELQLPDAVTGNVVLPPNCETLRVSYVRERLGIAGNVVELVATDCDPRCLPPAMLARIRRLALIWVDEVHDEFLSELARACPHLERLEIIDVTAGWHWEDAASVLNRLSRLRSFWLSPVRNRELADIARVFPDVCPLRGSQALTTADQWPRGIVKRSRAATWVGRGPTRDRAHRCHS